MIDMQLDSDKKQNYFELWHPLPDAPGRLYCEGVHDDYEGFRILLKGERATDHMIRVFFDGPLVYKINTECSKSLDYFDPGKEAFYIAEQSEWIDWFNIESCGIYENRKTKHYVILAANSCIDVISEREPKVKWL